MMCKYIHQECPFSECDWSEIDWCKQCKVKALIRGLKAKLKKCLSSKVSCSERDKAGYCHFRGTCKDKEGFFE